MFGKGKDKRRKTKNEKRKTKDKRAKGELLQKLSEYISRSTFSVSVDPSEFGVRYGLGDVVMCSSSRFGVTFSATVTGVDYSMDIRGENTSVILGDTILTALGEMRLNG